MKHCSDCGEMNPADIHTCSPQKPAQQEPVACVIDGDLYFHHEIDWEDLAYQGHGVELLYTSPPAQRKPLTDEQRMEIAFRWRDGNGTASEIIDMVEAAHGIKE